MKYSSHSVIVVDDEMELASLFKEYLVKIGYEVISFTDPALALDYFKKSSKDFSLILTDLRMPAMSGIDLAYEIRKHDPNVAIMLITAHLTDDLKLNEKFNSVKFCNVREKPVKFAKLRETIHSVLQPNIKVG